MFRSREGFAYVGRAPPRHDPLHSTSVRLEVAADGTASVEDLGSRNGTAVDGVRSSRDTQPLEPGALVSAGRTLLAATPTRPRTTASRRRPTGRSLQPPAARHRPPRRPTDLPGAAPPNDRTAAGIPLAASLIPLVLGVGLYLLTRLPTMLFFSLLSPVMAVSTYVEDRRQRSQGVRAPLARVPALLAEAARRARARASRRAAARRAAGRPPRAAAARAHARLALWERRPDDPDFLALRARQRRPAVARYA